jgi:aspartate 1-decarboxylase
VAVIRTYVGGKLHWLRVTRKSVAYRGSVGISADLMEAAGIEPYEQVTIVDLENGERWETYALPVAERGVFSLNGGGARLGEVGDRCVVMTYVQCHRFPGAKVLVLDESNEVIERYTYDPSRGDEPAP